MMKFCLLFLCFVASVDAQFLNMKVKGRSAILYNPENGAILFEKRAKEPHYPASITKIPAMFYVIERQKNLDVLCRASSEAIRMMNAAKKQARPMDYPAYLLEPEAIRMGLKEGERYPLRTLLYASLLKSCNDAANVVAENVSGSIKHFVAELNTYLQSRGIKESRFQNPHGLHHPAQMTTAHDMAKIAGLASENPRFVEIAGAVEFGAFRNTNLLVKPGKYQYPWVLWGKTGYVEKSGFNLVAVAEKEGRRLAVVLLGYENGEDRFKDAIALFERAFREKKKQRRLFAKGDSGFLRKILGVSGDLRARLDEDVAISYYPSEESKLSARILWLKLQFPIEEGALVGHLEVIDELGNQLARAPLRATVRIEERSYKVWWISGILALLASLALYRKFKKSRNLSV